MSAPSIDRSRSTRARSACAYRKPHTDHCVDNTIVQATRTGAELGQQTDPFTIIWFCTASDPRIIMPDYSNSMLVRALHASLSPPGS